MHDDEKLTCEINLSRILAAPMPDGCTVADYLEGALPGEEDMKALGISTEGYGISDIRGDIHDHFYGMLVRAILSAVDARPGDAVAQAVAAERERCAVIAEGNARGFDFQSALGEHDDAEYGANSARLEIAKRIRSGEKPMARVRVRPLDESKNTGWTDDGGRFCLPLSSGYFIKFPKDGEQSPMFMACYYHDFVGGSAIYKTAVKLAQEHHVRRVLSSVDIVYDPDPEPSDVKLAD